MKLILDIANQKLLLTPEQAAAIIETLHGCEYIQSKYVPGSGATKSSYIKLIVPVDIGESIKMGALGETEYNAMKLVTKLQGENE